MLSKLVALAILGGVAMMLGAGVLTLQIHVIQEKARLHVLKQRHQLKRSTTKSTSADGNSTTNETQILQHQFNHINSTTIQPSRPASKQDLHSYKRLQVHYNGGMPTKESGNAYWQMYQTFWRNHKEDQSDDSSISNLHESINSNKISPQVASEALRQAAKAGHPEAQHVVASAYASGIWPIDDGSTQQTLAVSDEFLVAHDKRHHKLKDQLVDSFLYWQYAAIAGVPEASLALATRLEQDDQLTCEDTLPYWEAAGNAIMDQLETSSNSRGKIQPPMDRHYLAQVHIHGGTSSQLDWNNKPDESPEALQFYHLKATTANDVTAAFTLAHLYHFGVRGVTQNLRKALFYYEIAAEAHHWESSAYVGLFHLWGIGMEAHERNLFEAYRHFKIAAPLTLESCRRRYESKLRNPEEDKFQCEPLAVHGFGILHLWGIPGLMKVDLEMAEKYLSLAKEMGSADATYNLAMMWMGWKTHYKNFDDLEEGGSSKAPEAHPELETSSSSGNSNKDFSLHVSANEVKGTFKGPHNKDITESIKLLQKAAERGHIQARHRLGLIYSRGVQFQTNTGMEHHVVKPDCKKAKGYFSWMVNNASPERSRALRAAYRSYMSGDLEASLRSYLSVAETGSSVGQANAAFLLERNVCLHLSPQDCAKASVRLWKAAANQGIAEASLRVGDFYYYGRLRSDKATPFGWTQYLLYPEQYLPDMIESVKDFLGISKPNVQQAENESSRSDCNEKNPSCISSESLSTLDEDLAKAAQYYQMAAEKHQSPRANFNLGFLHEFGLGLKQDFPLAKRHYDLAAGSEEAQVAVQLALQTMSLHQWLVRMEVSWNAWLDEKSRQYTRSKGRSGKKTTQQSTQPAMRSKSVADILIKHFFDWRTLVIFVLVLEVRRLMRIRRERTGQ